MRISMVSRWPIWVLATALVGCQTPYVEKSSQHLSEPTPPADVAAIPAPVAALPTPPRPNSTTPAPQTYTVVVTNAPVRELLASIARDARLNIDVHPGIDGVVSLNAIRQTLPQILDRVANQVSVRWRMMGDTLVIEPDRPFLRTYSVNYVNLVRKSKSDTQTSTVVRSGGSVSASGGSSSSGGGGTDGSGSTAKIENEGENRFWERLIKNLEDLLREDDRVSAIQTRIETGNSALNSPIAAPPVPPSANPLAALTALNAATNSAVPASTGAQQQTQQVDKAILIIANPETGTISVRATEVQHKKVREFLDRLTSSAQRQVLIEATIVEVELSHGFESGINWTDVFGTNGRFVYSQNFASLVTSSLVSTTNSKAGTAADTIKLLEKFGKTKVLSSPRLMALNNQPAMLKVVKDVPYFTISVKRTDATSTAPEKVEYTSVINTVSEGVVLGLTPQISQGGEIALNVRPTITRIVDYASDPAVELVVAQLANRNNSAAPIQSLIPVVQVRELESTLRLSDGQIGVLGGLIQDRVGDDQQGVPGLGRLPVVGNLFKYRKDNATKTELVVFLKPTIVRDPNIATDLKSSRGMLPTDQFFRDPDDYAKVTEGMPR